MATKNYDSIRDDYKTPAAIYQPILDFLGVEKFDLDVCCSDQNIPAKAYAMKDKVFIAETGTCLRGCADGLKISWFKKCFLNPPFPKCKHFMQKAVKEIEERNCEVWAVLPSDRFETVYYKKFILDNPHCVFGFLTGKQGFIVPGEEHLPIKPSQKIMIVCFSKRAAEIEYCWNREKLFNTKAFLGGLDEN